LECSEEKRILNPPPRNLKLALEEVESAGAVQFPANTFAHEEQIAAEPGLIPATATVSITTPLPADKNAHLQWQILQESSIEAYKYAEDIDVDPNPVTSCGCSVVKLHKLTPRAPPFDSLSPTPETLPPDPCP